MKTHAIRSHSCILFLGVTVLPKGEAQEWAPLHAIFYFSGYDSLSETPIEDFYMAARDTLIDGISCRVIVKSIFDANAQPLFFTYAQNDSVYIRGLDEEDETFYLWMDFSAAQGDTIELGAPIRAHYPEETYRAVVDSIETIQIGDTTCGLRINTRRFVLQPLDGYTFFSKNRYVELIGSTENLIPFPPATAQFMHSEFMCFHGASYAISVTPGPVCYVKFNSTSDTPSVANTLSFFPNPFQTGLTIKQKTPLDSPVYTIFSVTGQKIKAGLLSYPEIELSLGHLSPGTYWIQITSGEKTGTWKLVKPR